MKTTHMLFGALATLSLSACGGGNDSAPAPATPAPPTGGTPTTPAATDFNAYAVNLAAQTDAASERAAPIALDDQNFAFNESGTAFAALFPN